MLPIVFGYNNCGRSSSDLGDATSSSFLPGASDVLKRGDFEFFTPVPACDREVETASLTIKLDAVTGQSSLDRNQCGQQNTEQADIAKIKYQNHNPHLVYYEGRVFASPYLHEGISGHLYYLEYCSNEFSQVDFTIQYIQNGSIRKDYVGVTMFGPDSPLPGIKFNGGYIEEFSDGAKTFYSMNGTFRVEFQPPQNDTNKKATLISSRGEETPLTCWYHNP